VLGRDVFQLVIALVVVTELEVTFERTLACAAWA